VAHPLGVEGVSAHATVLPAADWLDELCGWVRRAPGDLGALGWPVVLMAERIDPAFARPPDARTVYQCVRWNEPLPPTPLELDVRPTWVSSGPHGSDISLVSTASSSGVPLAESHVVVRTASTLAPWGQPDTPPVPDAEAASRRLSLALSEHDVADFADLTGVHERLQEDPTHAWGLGHPNALVPELTLLLILMHVGEAGSPGAAEMWFHTPVPVGSLLTLWQGAGPGAGLWEMRSTGKGQVVAVGRLEGP
jgi:hypothetical protein